MRFEPDRKVRFSTYATWWGRAEICDCLLRNWSVVKVASRTSLKALFVALRRLRSRLEEATNRGELRQDLAERHGVSVAGVEAKERFALSQVLSLNAPFGEEESSTRQDGLADSGTSPEDTVMFYHDNETRSHWLRAAITRLPERDQAIIRARHLSEVRRTHDEPGLELGIGKERVRQLEQRAIQALRQSAGPSETDPAPKSPSVIQSR